MAFFNDILALKHIELLVFCLCSVFGFTALGFWQLPLLKMQILCQGRAGDEVAVSGLILRFEKCPVDALNL